MNRSALKKYAPQARLDFIEAVTQRARRLGLDPALPANIEQTGDVLLIGGQPFPASIAKQRATLAQRIHQQGFSVVVEALAYTWFNRLVAIRFMELKAYLSHGYRVLSHPQGQQPEILDNVLHLELFGLDKAEIVRLKTAGDQDEALYREILLAQCHELHRNMPFLFEALDDATELLLPDHLLRTNSPVARLVSDIEESDWKEVEIIGWLYQFYISEKKDNVMGKVVRSEDIPAATQLFTPNWIVQYLVQNSLGRLWLMANPGSSLKEKMPYYIEPVEQTPEVQAQLDSLIKVRMDEDGGSLNPENLTVLDPACGSGHILVEAYNLLRAIYEERGYRLRDIPRLILQQNLFGLDIDDRATQLAGFALLMKAREDDRRLFDRDDNPPHINVLAIQQSAGLRDEEMAQSIINSAIQIEGGDALPSGQLFGGGQLETYHSSGINVLDLCQLIKLFEHGKNFGSLIKVPVGLKAKLPKIVDLLVNVGHHGDDLSRSYANQVLEQFAKPARLLILKYDAVVANPPYMGNKGMNATLKDFAKKKFPDSKSDLFSMFIEQGFSWLKNSGFNSMVTMQSWMFLSSFEKIRADILSDRTIFTMAHLGARAFSEITGEVVQATVFSILPVSLTDFKPVFFRLTDGDEQVKKSALLAKQKIFHSMSQRDFVRIPGSPLAYWISSAELNTFSKGTKLGGVANPVVGLQTGNNDKFLRYWYEVSFSSIEFSARSSEQAISSGNKWFPYNKGGALRRWYGNLEYVVNWANDGAEIKSYSDDQGNIRSRPQNTRFYFKEGITWSDITTDSFAARLAEGGAIFDVKGSSAFPDQRSQKYVLGLLCSVLVPRYMKMLNPTSTFQVGDIARIPYFEGDLESVVQVVDGAVELAKRDWNSYETSFGFSGLFDFSEFSKLGLLSLWWQGLAEANLNRALKMSELEVKNNTLFIGAYGLSAELSPEVSIGDVTLSRADRGEDMQRLISYAIGCMMGRYSLDKAGLMYAHGGNINFDLSCYEEFSADADGILPITDESWFEDDVAERLSEFVKVVWGEATFVENMEWLADSLNRKDGEFANEAIRRYLSIGFYKKHLQVYKKRPIYWLFSSGKQKAFECLVYLHRYNEGTLSRIRMEYVVPLQGRMQARIDKLADDMVSVISSAQQKNLQKRKDKLSKQLEELRRFDEVLRFYADQRISLSLDSGVKVNYAKFGDLLAEVKVVTGGRDD